MAHRLLPAQHVYLLAGLTAAAGAAVVPAGCGSHGRDDARLLLEPASPSDCDPGGTRVAWGYDDDRDGVLDPSEIDDTLVVCNDEATPLSMAGGAQGGRGGAGGSTSSAPTTGEELGMGPSTAGGPAGSGPRELADGGSARNDNNNAGGTSEGTRGVGGISGLWSAGRVRTGSVPSAGGAARTTSSLRPLLLEPTPVDPGSECALGGTRFRVGLDRDLDGQLATEEVTDEAVVCITAALPTGVALDLTSDTLANRSAYIPPQCYTKTVDDSGKVHNPCYACHTLSPVPNYARDADLQLEYSFATPARNNPWLNLFIDRRVGVAAIGNDEILDYVRHDNYLDGEGRIRIARLLEQVPRGWDRNGDGEWNGYIPDCYFAFDGAGFDRAPDGEPTGWRAFAYAPFPGTFWPTNGSTDDVLIRLGPEYRQDETGNLDLEIYKLNLAIVEALVTRRDVPISPADETHLGVDLDHDGELDTATLVVFDWAPSEGRAMRWVGRARSLQERGQAPLAAGLFPFGTELLHSVRYLDVVDDAVAMARRMKELRYMRKSSWLSYSDLEQAAANEAKEKHDFPDRLRSVLGDVERGVSNGKGWWLQAFIEDARGDLRPQTYEELVACAGCHGGLGVTTDTVFSFPRKVPEDGWVHWTQRGLVGFPEPRRPSGAFEYTFYLQHNGAGDELRSNAEILDRFFDASGELLESEVEALHDDIGRLVLPSSERALLLDKAYRVIVEEQSFVRGRDATVTAQLNVHREVREVQLTGVEQPVSPADD